MLLAKATFTEDALSMHLSIPSLSLSRKLNLKDNPGTSTYIILLFKHLLPIQSEAMDNATCPHSPLEVINTQYQFHLRE